MKILNERGSYTGVDSNSDKFRGSENIAELDQQYENYLNESYNLPLSFVNALIATDMRLLYLKCRDKLLLLTVSNNLTVDF